MQRKFLKCLLLIFLLNSLAYTHGLGIDPLVEDKYEGLYAHPVSLIYGITKSEALIYFTLVWPAPIPVSAIVIQPSYLNKDDYWRIGSGLGYRLFLIDHFYAQVMPSAHYLKYDNASGAMIEVLGYLGGFGNVDVGVGYKWNFATKNHGLAIDVNFGFDAIILFWPLFLLL